MLVQSDLQALLHKPGFFDRMPELASLSARMEEPASRCRGCAKRRNERNVFAQFIGIVSKLNPDAVGRLKSELGLASFMYYGLNHATGRYEMKTI